MKWKPWTLFTVAVARWMGRQQQEVIAYLREENRILREKLGRKRILIHDRDPLFTKKFQSTLSSVGVRCLKMPKRSPNLNAYSESFVRTIKRECLDKMILFGEKHVRHVVDEFIDHYNKERPHQGLGNRLMTDLSCAAKGSAGCSGATIERLHEGWDETCRG